MLHIPVHIDYIYAVERMINQKHKTTNGKAIIATYSIVYDHHHLFSVFLTFSLEMYFSKNVDIILMLLIFFVVHICSICEVKRDRSEMQKMRRYSRLPQPPTIFPTCVFNTIQISIRTEFWNAGIPLTIRTAKTMHRIPLTMRGST